MVDEADAGSWGLMWNEKYSGKILTINNPRYAFGTAQFYLGLDINSTDESEWRIALNKLAEQKPLIQSYVMDEIFNKMEGGEAAIATYYAGDFLTMYSGNNDLAFYYPEEGTNIFVDSMCIPKGSEHKAEAEMYINFMLQKDIAIANAEYIMYASPNTQVYDDADYIYYISEYHENAFDILYSDTSNMNVCYYQNLPADTLVMVNNLWEELKVDSSTGNGIYIICGIIVLAGASLIAYKVIQKKKRSNY
jgi:spermidine/putrescine transport system substrate-binding protein